ncbi:MAG TPA: D-glycero-beta-D-manno-heptose 1-phosphate adenylyltransferase [Thermoguttaceae bacterium]|nr:D-glycero-beta-D-manno-heptose 1-phosphate adenylyltransferase [Thermoguttaceae bacterium]
MADQLTPLLTAPRRPRILVAGDVMLDRYLWGDVERISPEAPIPVLRVGRQEHRLGGAGSVVAMLAALEADVALAAITGDDSEGEVVRQLLDEVRVDRRCVVPAAGRPTTVKERLLGRTQSRYPQQMIRVDRENVEPIEAELVERLIGLVRQQLDAVDLVLVSDYKKGVCTDELVSRLVSCARDAGVPVVADPARSGDYRRYAGCSCITPNRTEAAVASGVPIRSPADGLEAARRLLEFDVEVAVVTLDRDGIVWADRSGRSDHCPARPRQVYDITGAGDMVISTLGYCLAAGADWPAAIELSNLAGGLEVERLGVVPLSRQELLAEVCRDAGKRGRKILSADELDAELQRRRKAGARIVMTNGCYDLLHPGHVAALEQARKLGDCLVVGVNSDRSVRELKGPGRPIIDEQGRAAMLAALGCVDYVVVFDDASVTKLVERVLPDVLVKSAQYRVEEVVGHEIVQHHGGQVVLAPLKGGYSTTELIEKIAGLAADAAEGPSHTCRCEKLTGRALSEPEGPSEAAA